MKLHRQLSCDVTMSASVGSEGKFLNVKDLVL